MIISYRCVNTKRRSQKTSLVRAERKQKLRQIINAKIDDSSAVGDLAQHAMAYAHIRKHKDHSAQRSKQRAYAEGGKGEGKSEGGKKELNDGEKRKRLLSALRPYLSDNRRDALDQVLKVTEMTDLLGTLGDRKGKS